MIATIIIARDFGQIAKEVITGEIYDININPIINSNDDDVQSYYYHIIITSTNSKLLRKIEDLFENDKLIQLIQDVNNELFEVPIVTAYGSKKC